MAVTARSGPCSNPNPGIPCGLPHEWFGPSFATFPSTLTGNGTKNSNKYSGIWNTGIACDTLIVYAAGFLIKKEVHRRNRHNLEMVCRLENSVIAMLIS